MVKKQPPRKPSQPKKNPQPTESPPPPIDPQLLLHQQRILTLFSDAFHPVLSSDDFATRLQSIKQALFNRDFDAAFGSEENLQAYAARWSPTRALCYSSIFQSIAQYMNAASSSPSEDNDVSAHQSEPSSGSEPRSTAPTTKMLCIGGCAAEQVAFASHIHQQSSSGTLSLLDAGPWKSVTQLLQNSITSPPVLSKYASAAAKAANLPLLERGQLETTFTQADVLSLERSALQEIVGSSTGEPLTVTMLFTLNELYTNGGIGKTTNFLKLLGQLLPRESLLLVVDSPGSYSEAAVGKEKKRYPMQWLLDHTLLDPRAAAAQSRGDYEWEKLESHDSIWFRLPEGLSYPIQLENMRYQMHLYRKKSTSSTGSTME